jgi:hypothetical protein
VQIFNIRLLIILDDFVLIHSLWTIFLIRFFISYKCSQNLVRDCSKKLQTIKPIHHDWQDIACLIPRKAKTFNFVGFQVLTVVIMKSSSSWVSTPCRNQHDYLLHTGFLHYSLTLKVEVTCSPKTSVHFHCTAWHYFPESSLHNVSFTWLWVQLHP